MKEIINNPTEKRWISTAELCSYLGVGRNRAVAFSKKVGACKAVTQRRNIHDRCKIDSALESM